jgi:hypothetical protein
MLALIPWLTAVPVAAGDRFDEWSEAPADDLATRVAAVNEGELKLLPAAAAVDAHTHLNRIRIHDASLTGGWVELEQCHRNLDAVPAAEITFRADGIRRLRITESHNIERAWVDGASVQLRAVGTDAKLCLAAESRALHALEGGLYRLRNGPYMRRFLDGYYPMRVVLDIAYPADRLRLIGQSPVAQPGLAVAIGAGTIALEATFEGRLITCLDFCERPAGDCGGQVTECASGPPF